MTSRKTLVGPHISPAPWPRLLRRRTIFVRDTPLPRESLIGGASLALLGWSAGYLLTSWAEIAPWMIVAVIAAVAVVPLLSAWPSWRRYLASRRHDRALRRILIQYDLWNQFHRAPAVRIDLPDGRAAAVHPDGETHAHASGHIADNPFEQGIRSDIDDLCGRAAETWVGDNEGLATLR